MNKITKQSKKITQTSQETIDKRLENNIQTIGAKYTNDWRNTHKRLQNNTHTIRKNTQPIGE